MVKLAEDAGRDTFRGRARQDYEERRAEGRLGPAQRTCANLDEKGDISVSYTAFVSDETVALNEDTV